MWKLLSEGLENERSRNQENERKGIIRKQKYKLAIKVVVEIIWQTNDN